MQPNAREPGDVRDDSDETSSLRSDITALTADLQKVLAENARLRRRLDGEPAPRHDEGADRVSDLRRVRQEIDELTRRYDLASGRTTPRDARRRQRRRGSREELGSRLRQMMMLMIMSELC